MCSRRDSDGLIVGSVADMLAAGGGTFHNWWGPVFACPACRRSWGEYDRPARCPGCGAELPDESPKGWTTSWINVDELRRLDMSNEDQRPASPDGGPPS